jgi:hypothetical protein
MLEGLMIARKMKANHISSPLLQGRVAILVAPCFSSFLDKRFFSFELSYLYHKVLSFANSFWEEL